MLVLQWLAEFDDVEAAVDLTEEGVISENPVVVIDSDDDDIEIVRLSPPCPQKRKRGRNSEQSNKRSRRKSGPDVIIINDNEANSENSVGNRHDPAKSSEFTADSSRDIAGSSQCTSDSSQETLLKSSTKQIAYKAAEQKDRAEECEKVSKGKAFRMEVVESLANVTQNN